MLIWRPQNWSLRFELMCRVCEEALPVKFTQKLLTSQVFCRCGALNTVTLDGLPPLDVSIAVKGVADR